MVCRRASLQAPGTQPCEGCSGSWCRARAWVIPPKGGGSRRFTWLRAALGEGRLLGIDSLAHASCCTRNKVGRPGGRQIPEAETRRCGALNPQFALKWQRQGLWVGPSQQLICVEIPLYSFQRIQIFYII